MTEGFYFHRNHLYYGSYNEKQVSGRVNISKVKLQHIQTNHPISEDDWAVRLWDNHSLLEPEYMDLQAMLLKMRAFMNLSTGQEIDFSAVENRLDISLPKELKRIYLAIQNQEEYFTSTEHFLPLDEMYMEQGILVFFKKKRTPIAGYDIKNGCCVGRMLTITIENKPVFKKGRCKGKFVTTLDIERELENFCNEDYHLLSEFHVYGIAVIYPGRCMGNYNIPGRCDRGCGKRECKVPIFCYTWIACEYNR